MPLLSTLTRRGRLANQMAATESGRKRIVAFALASSGLGRLVVIDRGQYRIRLENSALSASLWVDPTERIREENLLRRLIRPGDIVVDVGANIGTVSLAVATEVGPHGQVIAVEPHPRTYRILLRNLRLNRVTNVQPLNLAVGSTVGRTRLTDTRSDDQNQLTGGELDGGIDTKLGGVPVQVVRLDSIVTAPVALVKIDVEGFEIEAIRGLGARISDVELIQFEYHEKALAFYGRTGDELRDLVLSFGFSIYAERGGTWHLVRGRLRTSECVNLLAVRDDAVWRLGELGDALEEWN